MQVHTVWHTLVRDGKNIGHHTTDMVFFAGTPRLVFEWFVTDDGEVPAVWVELDPQWLFRLNWPTAEYGYQLPIDDPRTPD
jgi:hypothetical protein